MKWIALIAALMVMPGLRSRAVHDERLRVALAFLVGFLPFFNVDLNLVSDPSYRGDTRGLEISLVDLVAWTLAGAVQRTPRRPYSFVAPTYFMVALASILVAPRPEFALYGALKIARLYVLTIIVERAVRDRLGSALLRGLAAGLIYTCVVALKQRYLEHAMQVHGPFVHQNGIGMTADLVTPALVGLVLAGYGGRFAVVAVGSGALAIVLSLSRGALMMMPLAWAMVYIGSLRRRVTGRKLGALALAVIAAAIVLAKSMDSLVERFSEAPDASAHARTLFERAAGAMLDEHPLGVGINQFSWVLSHEGYADRFEIPPIDRDGIVHNIYRLTGAELGWPGIISFGLLFGSALLTGLLALRRAWKSSDPRVDLLLGFTASLVVTYMHGTLEWSLRTTPIGQVLWIAFGFIAALSASLRNSRVSR